MKTNPSDFLFEAAALKRLKRTGWQILGENQESIAEHTFMVVVISYVLAKKFKVNLEKILIMALFHDFEEGRTGDVYKLADLYTKTDKKKALRDVFSHLEKPKSIIDILKDYHQANTLAAKIVKDADTLALCIELKQLVEKGNIHAKEWLTANLDSLKTSEGKKLGSDLVKTDSQNWWKKERKILHNRLKKVGK
ncbi:hypothetical protein A2W14_05890 [Candidatus Gottesmanbacteria bacterium RBG_16_37_8]|uniref:5'-deoxynucleotidase n=1 Tax=Candidatus Gottesmanbacteria bacterium RBG_16_37_8 TaxID=1798371 RepID=A0A1F5YV17_9BACT|nr:MAG: hypothetical protein A2W14_05890 [Candidatus Gottesmanbacteria bacterium RBG_16_37_8]